MTLNAIYLISIDGKPLFTEIFENRQAMLEDLQLSNLLVTLNSGIIEDIVIEMVMINGINYYFRNFEKFHIVAVSDEDLLSSILDKIGASFLLEYEKELDDWDGDQNKFRKFSKEVKRIIEYISQFGFTESLDPSKSLDTVAIYHLPKALQQTALVMATLQMGTIREIARQLDENPDVVRGYLSILQQEGYVGVIERGARSMYFATT